MSASSNDSRLGLHFGAISDPITRQLIEQGYAPDVSDCARWQKLADAITMLKVHSYIGDRKAADLRKKLLKQIGKELT